MSDKCDETLAKFMRSRKMRGRLVKLRIKGETFVAAHLPNRELLTAHNMRAHISSSVFVENENTWFVARYFTDPQLYWLTRWRFKQNISEALGYKHKTLNMEIV